MKNSEIAKLFEQMAIYLEMKNIQFKPQAYRNAALAIETVDNDIEEIFKKSGEKGLEEISGVGVSVAEKIIEYLKTGEIKELEIFKKEIPVDVETLSAIEGVGAKIIYKLYKELKIKNLKDLEEACKKHKIKNLQGFGEKSEERILKGIEFLKQGKGKFILGSVIPIAENLLNYLKQSRAIKKAVIAGSYRRKKETIGDIDILAISNDSVKAMEHFIKFDEVAHIYAKGETKTMVRLKNGIDVDLRVVQDNSYGAALLYFTGSKEHNIKLRELAIKKNWKLNEYGLFQIKNVEAEILIVGKIEEEIYEKLEMQYIEPELREGKNEIELALKNQLPKLVEYENIKGDLQLHTTWSEGENSIKEMSDYAQKIGLEYICITDHTKSLKIANGLDEKRLLMQIIEIKKLNSKLENLNSKFTILTGAEVNILKDGSLDIDDEILEKLDFVGAAIHSNFNLSKSDQTERMKKAMVNKNIDCIFHPTGRLINKRPGYEININKIIDFAKKTHTILEINAQPYRLDLKDEYIKKCVAQKVKMTIGTDAHHYSQFHFFGLGVSQARRGWAENEDILNTLPVEKFLKSLVKNK